MKVAAAIKDLFGDGAVILRCRVYKQRNASAHLPEAERWWVKVEMLWAWRNPNSDHGIAELRCLTNRLEKVNPHAAGSMREGLRGDVPGHPDGVERPPLKSLETAEPGSPPGGRRARDRGVGGERAAAVPGGEPAQGHPEAAAMTGGGTEEAVAPAPPVDLQEVVQVGMSCH